MKSPIIWPSSTFPTTLPPALCSELGSPTLSEHFYSSHNPVRLTSVSTSIREPDHMSTQTPPFLSRCHLSTCLELLLVNGASLARKMIRLPELRRAVKPTKALLPIPTFSLLPKHLPTSPPEVSPSLATNSANNITVLLLPPL